jgi:hypothetical protein
LQQGSAGEKVRFLGVFSTIREFLSGGCRFAASEDGGGEFHIDGSQPGTMGSA